MEAKIFSALCDVMSEIGAIGKDQKNQQQNFMYRGVDAVYNALQPALIRHHVFVVPEVLEQHREERQTQKGGNLIYAILKIRFTFYAQDGSNVSAVVVGEGMDSGDKASNKAMSAAFKYACFEVLCIPTEEMKDPDADSPAASKPKGMQKISPQQVSELAQELERTGWSVEPMLEYLNQKFGHRYQKMEEMTQASYQYILPALKGRADKAAERG